MSNLFQTFGLGQQGGVYIPKLKHRVLTPKRKRVLLRRLHCQIKAVTHPSMHRLCNHRYHPLEC